LTVYLWQCFIPFLTVFFSKQVNKYLIHGIKPGDSKNTAPDDVRDAPHTEAGNVPEGETPIVDLYTYYNVSYPF
jgi:hypothetical protein